MQRRKAATRIVLMRVQGAARCGDSRVMDMHICIPMTLAIN